MSSEKTWESVLAKLKAMEAEARRGGGEERLQKQEFVAYQASPRGGVVRVRVEGDRVRLAGQAVTVLRGELLDAPKSGT